MPVVQKPHWGREVVHERLLEGMEAAWTRQRFHRLDGAAIAGGSERDARETGLTVDDDGAGPAGALAAALLDRSRVETVAKQRQERFAA